MKIVIFSDFFCAKSTQYSITECFSPKPYHFTFPLTRGYTTHNKAITWLGIAIVAWKFNEILLQWQFAWDEKRLCPLPWNQPVNCLLWHITWLNSISISTLRCLSPRTRIFAKKYVNRRNHVQNGQSLFAQKVITSLALSHIKYLLWSEIKEENFVPGMQSNQRNWYIKVEHQFSRGINKMMRQTILKIARVDKIRLRQCCVRPNFRLDCYI